MTREQKLRKSRYIITGEIGLCGLTKEVADGVVALLKSNGKNVKAMTEYHYRDECGFRGMVSTDYP